MLLTKKKKQRKTDAPEQPPMLIWAQICEQYPSTWVLIAEPKCDRYQQVLRGRVVAHGPDPDEVTRMISKFGLRDSGVLFTGVIRRPRTAFMLSPFIVLPPKERELLSRKTSEENSTSR